MYIQLQILVQLSRLIDIDHATPLPPSFSSPTKQLDKESVLLSVINFISATTMPGLFVHVYVLIQLPKRHRSLKSLIALWHPSPSFSPTRRSVSRFVPRVTCAHPTRTSRAELFLRKTKCQVSRLSHSGTLHRPAAVTRRRSR